MRVQVRAVPARTCGYSCASPCPLRRDSLTAYKLRSRAPSQAFATSYVQRLPRMCANFFSCKMFRPFQGRSSVVEQRPFKPKVVGSIPTAPTKLFRVHPFCFALKSCRYSLAASFTPEPRVSLRPQPPAAATRRAMTGSAAIAPDRARAPNVRPPASPLRCPTYSPSRETCS
jgi:hypothetical protein